MTTMVSPAPGEGWPETTVHLGRKRGHRNLGKRGRISLGVCYAPSQSARLFPVSSVLLLPRSLVCADNECP